MRRDVTVGSRRIAYEEVGSGSPLILLHAFPLSADMWRPQLEAPPPGWRVIAPDFRGFAGLGLSASSPPNARSMDDHADDILSLMDALSIERAVLGGLSMGGYVTFAIMRRAADRARGLVLADTRAEPDTPEGRESRTRAQEVVRREGAAAIADMMVPRFLGSTTLSSRPDLIAYARSLILANTPDAIDAALECLKTRADSVPLLPHLGCPALIIVGEEDMLTPVVASELMHRTIPRSTLHVIPQAGHLSNLEQPAMFNLALHGFLNEVAP
jgi:3-oxoadipate enol-lactonase